MRGLWHRFGDGSRNTENAGSTANCATTKLRRSYGWRHSSDGVSKGSASRCSGALFKSISTCVLSRPPPDIPPTNQRSNRAGSPARNLALKPYFSSGMQSRVGTTLIATAEIMARELDYKRKKIVVDNRLYPGDVDKMLTIIHKLDDALQRVMLFSHNPALTELAHRLSSDIVHMPTCAVAKFKFRSK